LPAQARAGNSAAAQRDITPPECDAVPAAAQAVAGRSPVARCPHHL